MHVFSGFSGLIVYGENIYKEYNRKKIINFVAVWNWKQSWGKNIPKSASERAAAILVWKSAV